MSESMTRLRSILAPLSAIPAPGELLQALEQLRRAIDVRQLLAQIAGDDAQLDRIACRSYAHSNGFDKLVLDEAQHYKLRLHIWWHGIRGVESDYHNHNWDFASWILRGTLRTELFEIADADTPAAGAYDHYQYAPSTTKAMTYQMSYRGRQYLRKTFSTLHAADSCYAIDHRFIHSGNPVDDEPTATLVLQSPTCVEANDVFKNELAGDEAEQIACSSFGPKRLKDMLTQLQLLLTSASHP
jgi:hypothetical protein